MLRHACRHPLHQGLRDGRAPVVAETERAAPYADKAARIAALQLDGAVTADFEPGRLFGAAFALATWWLTMPQPARMALSGADGSPEATRDGLVRMVRALTAPGTRAR
ncbi:hypothetical protein AB0I93_09245 [Streptomyces sp. NPDC049967]|uniref:hypothetical protein n=1 Tax=Streptomyces sp. NPDC049967 TaxID=3155658 RepID=UPI00341E4BB8